MPHPRSSRAPGLHRVLRAGGLTTALLAGVATAQPPATPPVLPPGQTVTVDGAKLWYLSEGRGEPLVVITGGPGAAHYLYPYFSSLQATHRVIYLDSFGCGNSDRAKDRSGYTFARHVDEIEGFRRALGLERINLLGHSYGSLVVQAYALKYPQSLHRLILAAPFTGGEAWQAGNENVIARVQRHFPEIWARVVALRARGLKPTDKEFADVWGSVPEALLYYANVCYAGRLTVDFNPEVALALTGDEGDFVVGGDVATLDFRPHLKSIRAPILVIAGRYDYVSLPLHTLAFKTHAPQADFIMLEQSGHNFFLDEPVKMLEALRTFLAKPAAQ